MTQRIVDDEKHLEQIKDSSKNKKKDWAECSKRKTSGKRQTCTYCDSCTQKPEIYIGDCLKKLQKLKVNVFCNVLMIWKENSYMNSHDLKYQ